MAKELSEVEARDMRAAITRDFDAMTPAEQRELLYVLAARGLLPAGVRIEFPNGTVLVGGQTENAPEPA